MLKKIFIAALSVFALVAGQFNFCNAAMSQSQMFLGGITVGTSYSEMIKIYGAPIQVADHIEDNYACRYGNSVAVGYNKFANKIQSVVVSANNGWKNPDGLAVGMKISAAQDLYGTPDYTKSGAKKTAHCYFGDNRRLGFVIVFDNESEKILELGLYGGNTMVTFEESYQSIMERMTE